MAWKPKTVAGKILKGAVIAGGSVLGLVTGVGIIGKAGGVIARSAAAIKTAANSVTAEDKAKGTTVISRVGQTITSGVRATVDKVKDSAINLVAGTTAAQRDYIKSIKARSREEQEKLLAVEKAVNAGATVAEARAAVGLSAAELTSYDGEKIQQAGMFDFLQNKNVLYVLGGVALLFILSKRK